MSSKVYLSFHFHSRLILLRPIHADIISIGLKIVPMLKAESRLLSTLLPLLNSSNPTLFCCILFLSGGFCFVALSLRVNFHQSVPYKKILQWNLLPK